jgi:hypothetical protein
MMKTRANDEPGEGSAWRIATSAITVTAELTATAPLHAAQREVTPREITIEEPQPNEEPPPDDTPWAVGAAGTCSRSQVNAMQV